MKVEITGEKIHELLDSLPPEARKAFEGLIMKSASKNPIAGIKNWLSHYEDDCPIDTLIALIASRVIREIGIGINEDMRSTKKSGSRHYTGREATLCAISHLEKIANDLKSHLDHDECSTCCDQKH